MFFSEWAVPEGRNFWFFIFNLLLLVKEKQAPWLLAHLRTYDIKVGDPQSGTPRYRLPGCTGFRVMTRQKKHKRKFATTVAVSRYFYQGGREFMVVPIGKTAISGESPTQNKFVTENSILVIIEGIKDRRMGILPCNNSYKLFLILFFKKSTQPYLKLHVSNTPNLSLRIKNLLFKTYRLLFTRPGHRHLPFRFLVLVAQPKLPTPPFPPARSRSLTSLVSSPGTKQVGIST